MSDANTPPTDATLLLNAAAAGSAGASHELLVLVYDQLRRAAQQQMGGERQNHTLSATALVHEAYLRLLGPREVAWTGRAHFYAAAAEAMRRILLDHAKGRARAKRGGGRRPVDLDAGITLGFGDEEGPDFVALDQAICRLEARDPRAAQVVRMRFYAGLSSEQSAQALGISERTVKNDWAFARAWLAREMATDVE